MKNASAPLCVAVVGRGRMGTALARALADGGLTVVGPLGREFDTESLVGSSSRPPEAVRGGADADSLPAVAPDPVASTTPDAVLLCVPDAEIASVAAKLASLAGRRSFSPSHLLVGHCSGATALDSLAPHESFSIHPLMTLAGGDSPPDVFRGASCAVAGSTPRALGLASRLATGLGMHAFEVADEDRVAYHAAAAMASNFLVTLEAAAERLAATAGVAREHLVPLVRATVENWATLGPDRALTGPIARGDAEVVQAHRAELTRRAPELIPLFDELVRATGSLAARKQAEAGLTEAGDAPMTPARDRNVLDPVRTVAELRRHVAAARRAGQTVGLVPTMGALHEGHLSLIRRARSECDQVVVSIFVNPTQFAPTEDLATYPRDEQGDRERARAAGATLVFAPPVSEVYPAGFATTVSVGGLSERMEGASRGAEHFSGVTTVVAKLLNMVRPDAGYFGQKDAQQAVLIRRLVVDLDMPVRIEVCPTVRDADGLALSSRNAYLSPQERARALALRRALDAVERAVASGERDAGELTARGREAMAALGVEPEYLDVVDPDTLEPVATLSGPVLVAVAAHIGPARLIDNAVIDPLTARPGGGDSREVLNPAAEPRSISLTTIPAGTRRPEIGAQPCNA